MGDFLLELLSPLLELLFEAFCEYALAVMVDAGLRMADDVAAALEIKGRTAAYATFGVLGTTAGLLSLLVFAHPLLGPSRFHGISLLLSPVLAGLMLSWNGAALRKRNKEVTLIQSFGYGFTFALGMALMRFLFAR